jgi:predicted transcriptional regulator
MAKRLSNKGYSNVAIGKRMGINESTVRSFLAPGQAEKADILSTVSGMLKDQIADKTMIDIGTGVERHIGVSSTKLATAVSQLKEEGYTVHYIKVEQLGTGQQTTIKVLAGPNVKYGDVYRNRNSIRQITEFSDDGGRTFLGIDPPLSVNSKRVGIRYAEDGGTDADGVIYVRPGVKDLSMGNARYAQVRIAVDGTHYLKGMAVLKDDLPSGLDLVFNTNKSSTGNKLDALKKMKDDPDNPFGAIVRQIYSVDSATGKRHLSSALNIVNEEGDWEKWSKNLSSQMLSKQSPSLAKTQLDMTYERKTKELQEIMGLTNPSVRRKLLESYSDDVDSAAVHLKAAALHRQGSHVILPVNTINEHEIYAPNYRDGERVALVRYPHGGIFEIPELTVNNRHPEAKKILGRAKDAVGINAKVAERLSGADFDGDTVLVIPNSHGKVKTEPAIQGLITFDPKSAYPSYPGMKPMSARTKAFEMGDVSNLITDMTIKGATQIEIARAVRHSMVVIDAEKHNLNWKQSAIDNGIKQLKAKYQGKANAGASTLISRASSRLDVPERKARSASAGGPISRTTGEKVYVPTDVSWINSKGRVVFKMQRSTKLAEAKDAHSLSSNTSIERVYAEHSNRLKALANKARLAMISTKSIPYSPTARTVYADQVITLNAKLNVALRNTPLERQAQLLANAIVAQKKDANPDLEPSEIKKLKAQALGEARLRTGAHKERVIITNDEWAAIQAGAISSNKLNQILANSDIDQIKKLATPKQELLMTSLMRQRAKNMYDYGYSQADIADALGVSVSTLKRGLE